MNEAMNPTTIYLIVIFLYVLGSTAAIILFVLIIRWLFRIDEIVAILKDILYTIRRQNSDTSLQLCEGCNRNFDKSQLKIIASGQMLCPECINNLKKKKMGD